MKQALAEYAKRLSAYVKLELVEVADEATPDGPSDAERERVLAAEGERILRHVRDRDAVVVLDIQGKAMTSEQWSARFESLMAGDTAAWYLWWEDLWGSPRKCCSARMSGGVLDR
ncbi:hypothetical protein GCM10025857_21390 [Alicyclobacillus contaminans]|nr:hypothetical protein GCM10025857_21390 [Alicyclobacillus contaminans]